MVSQTERMILLVTIKLLQELLPEYKDIRHDIKPGRKTSGYCLT